MIFANASVRGTRIGTTVYSSRRIQLEFPTLRERMEAVGAIYDARMFDEAGAAWRQGDIVTLLSLDGFTALPQVTRYRINQCLQMSAPLPVVEAELVGAAQ